MLNTHPWFHIPLRVTSTPPLMCLSVQLHLSCSPWPHPTWPQGFPSCSWDVITLVPTSGTWHMLFPLPRARSLSPGALSLFPSLYSDLCSKANSWKLPYLNRTPQHPTTLTKPSTLPLTGVNPKRGAVLKAQALKTESLRILARTAVKNDHTLAV